MNQETKRETKRETSQDTSHQIFQMIYKINPRNEREYNDIIEYLNRVTWKTYALWAFGDYTNCCICEDIPDHYIKCHTCDEIICNDCFENDRLCGDAFRMIVTTDTKGELGAYYCKECYKE